MKTSSKKIQSNQSNSEKSTGPATASGRAISKMNALKHGILARKLLVHSVKLKESSREFATLHDRFWEELNPVGPVEEMLADQIVTANWRLQRVLVAESGEIGLSVDLAGKNQGPSLEKLLLAWRSLDDPITHMEASTWGNEMLKTHMRQLMDSVKQAGELTTKTIENLLKWFNGRPNRLTQDLELLRLRLLTNPDGLDEAALAERRKTQALGYLERQLERIKWQLMQCEKQENTEIRGRQAAAILPSPEILDKIMRYETNLNRHLYKALMQLERLQRTRQGEVLPPPITVELNEP